MDCIFCKIVKGKIPSTKIYEDEDVYAFLDIHPANKGHTLVIPKEHYETFNKMPTMVLQHLIAITQKIARAIDRSQHADGYNILMNNHPAAGQIVSHAHCHIIPRFANDQVNIHLGEKTFIDVSEEIKTSLE